MHFHLIFLNFEPVAPSGHTLMMSTQGGGGGYPNADVVKVDGWLGGSAHGHIGEVRHICQLSTPKAEV